MPFLNVPNVSERRVEELPFSYGVKARSGGRRVLSFLTSLFLHGLFCCGVFLFPSLTPEPAPSADGIPERLKQSGKTYKLVWYRLNNLPDVSSQRPGTGVQAEKRVTSMQKIQVDAENAKSRSQMVWHPVPKIQLEQDLKSPNLVITQTTLPPSPIKLKPKVFVPPTQQTTPLARAKALPLPPTIQDQQMRLIGLGNSIPMASVQTGPRPKPRAFIAPAPQPPNSDRPAFLPLDLPPAVTGPGAVAAGSTVMVTTGMTGPPPDAGPPLQPVVVGQTGGVSGPVAAAVIGTAPEGDLTLPPEGNRSAKLSTGGPNGTGAAEVQSAKVVIPGLSVRSPGASNDGTGIVPPPARPPFRPDSSRRGQSQPGRVPTQTLLSAPLRPNARRIPAWIEARFSSRVLYTSVLETSHGRWQIWFAEQNRAGSDAPPMRAPLPATSIVNAVWTIPTAPGQKVQIGAVVRKDGTLDSVTVVQALDSRAAQSLVEELKLLRFTPAMRFNTPVDIDIVIDIPPSSVTSLAEKTNP
jgi:hypothetical protein